MPVNGQFLTPCSFLKLKGDIDCSMFELLHLSDLVLSLKGDNFLFILFYYQVAHHVLARIIFMMFSHVCLACKYVRSLSKDVCELIYVVYHGCEELYVDGG